MPWGVVAGAVIGAVGSAYSANKQSGAAKDAAKAQADAANSANSTQLQMYNQTRADNQPFLQNGLIAQNQYMQMLGLSPYGSVSNAQSNAYDLAKLASIDPAAAYLKEYPDVAADPNFANAAYKHYLQYGKAEGRDWGLTDAQKQLLASGPPQTTSGTSNTSANQQAAFDLFRNTPGYQFGLDQGTHALDSSAAASGGLFSGKAGKELFKFGNDYADQQGYTPYMNRLASLAGMAQTANSQNAQYGMNTANQIGQNTIGAGAARASGLIGSANAWGSAANNIAGIASGALNQWGAYQNSNSYMPSYASVGSAPTYTVNDPMPTYGMQQPQLYGGY